MNIKRQLQEIKNAAHQPTSDTMDLRARILVEELPRPDGANRIYDNHVGLIVQLYDDGDP